MSKMMILLVITFIVASYIGIQKVIQKFGFTAILLCAFCILTLYCIARLYTYGVEHPNE
jgi:hypothetical protein